jgi:uncharacterized membrane protein
MAECGSVILLAVVWVYLGFGATSLIREILAVPLVLLVPGGLLVMMLPSRPADPFFQLALAVGLSIALCIMVGLLLNALPQGIDSRSWACALGLMSVTEAVVVTVQRVRAGVTLSDSLSSILGPAGPKAAVFAAIAVLAILGGLVAIVAWERSDAEAANSAEEFSELWVQPASSGAVVVGVHSDTSGTKSFRLSVNAPGKPTESFTFTLKSQQTWTHEIPVPPHTTARVLISLFSGSSSQPSERVSYQPSASG